MDVRYRADGSTAPMDVTGCPASASALPALAESAASAKCMVLYDRHSEKNGGSTMRTIYKRLEEHGECIFMGYDIRHVQWNALIAALRNYTSDPNASPPPRLCIEAHAGESSSSQRQLIRFSKDP